MRVYRIQRLTMGGGGGKQGGPNHFPRPEPLLPPQKLYSLFLLKTSTESPALCDAILSGTTSSSE